MILFLFSFVLAQELAEFETSFMSSPRLAGRGMAGVAYLGGPEAVLVNPALLSREKPTFFLSSYTLLDEIDNTNTAVSFPLGTWAMAIGYQGKKISNIDVIPRSALDIQGKPVESLIQSATVRQETYYWGISNQLFKNKKGWFKSLSLGLNFKTLSIRSAGAEGIKDFNALGYELDLGLKTDLSDTWAVGLSGKNILPYKGSGGGSLVWQNGKADELAAVYTFGNCFSYNDGGVVFLLDTDFYQNGYQPNLMRGGADLGLSEYFRLRSGFYQYPFATGSGYIVYNAFTMGFSLIPFKDLSLDYAYYPSDGFGANAVHYAGLSFDSFDLFLPSSANFQAKMEYDLQVLSPNDYLVLEQSLVSLNCVVKGEKTITVNDQAYAVVADKIQLAYPLNPGRNDLIIQMNERKVNRMVWRALSLSELIANNQDKDVRRLIITKAYNSSAFPDKEITNGELADYLAQSLDLLLPEGFGQVFHNIDLLYLNGYWGDNDQLQEDVQVSLGDTAKILARVEGYDYILSSSAPEEQARQAVDILCSTGYYQPAEFVPLDKKLTARKFISMLARTGAVNKQLQETYQDQPFAWVDLPGMDRVDASAAIIGFNQGKLVRAEYQINGQVVTLSFQEAVNLIKLNLSTENENVLTVNYLDKFSNKYVFNFNLGKVIIPTKTVEIIPEIKKASIVSINSNLIPIAPGSMHLRVIAKISNPKIAVGADQMLYAGVFPTGDDVSVVKFVLPVGEVMGVKINNQLWKATHRIPATEKGEIKFKVFVKTKDGALYTQVGRYFVINNGKVVPEKIKTVKPTKTTKSSIKPTKALATERGTGRKAGNLNRPFYPMQILFEPAVPALGDTLKVKVKVDSTKIVKATMEINDKQKIPMVKNGTYWVAKKKIPMSWRGQTILIKCYVKDKVKNVSMMEKTLRF